MASFRIDAIGVVRTPFLEKKDAPRQPSATRDVSGRVELVESQEMHDALSDIDAWSHLWILYVFDRRGEGWSPKVQPPRSDRKRGVLSTRSPHRPSPIGLSAVRLERVEGCVLHIKGVDMLDGSPVIDIKPYVAYTDAITDASAGWLTEDPRPRWTVLFEPEASADLAFLAARGVALEEAIVQALSLGPEPHAYRRIKNDVLSIKDWRARFSSGADTVIRVLRIDSGWREEQCARDPALAVHREFYVYRRGK